LSEADVIATQARALLERVFGYPAFRGQQAEIVAHVAAGGDALVLMPTGGGKSVCYQIPALLREGTGVVVSPLIALMHDQVAALRELGIAAAYLNSSLTDMATATPEYECRRVRSLSPSPSPRGGGECRESATRLSR